MVGPKTTPLEGIMQAIVEEKKHRRLSERLKPDFHFFDLWASRTSAVLGPLVVELQMF